MIKEKHSKIQNISDVEKKNIAMKVSYIVQKQLKSALYPTVQYIKKSLVEELLNEYKKSHRS